MFFSDAVFAIAMTLLVVGIGIPHVASAQPRHALERQERRDHQLLHQLPRDRVLLARAPPVLRVASGAVDTVFMVVNLLYLAAIAFTPFPTALVGVYRATRSRCVLYARRSRAASLLRVLMLDRAHTRRSCSGRRMRDEYYRFSLLASSAPVAAFAVAIPIAFADTSLALPFLLVLFPVEHLLDRYVKPPDQELLDD